MSVSMEDSFADIIGKAQRGHGLADSALAQQAGLSIDALQRLKGGESDTDAIQKIAPVLGLNTRALLAAAQGSWTPAVLPPLAGLEAFNTPFDDMTVNSYLIWDPETREAAAFDTGSDCSGMLSTLDQQQLKLTLILLTHTHGDHVLDLDRLKERTGAPAFVPRREAIAGAEPFDEGREFRVGHLPVESRLTSGHSAGGMTFVVNGLARPVAVVGDSLFAGSMGGGGVSYDDAIRNNLEKILTLPEETILCPGHGPLTTVGEERRHNPFFAS